MVAPVPLPIAWCLLPAALPLAPVPVVAVALAPVTVELRVPVPVLVAVPVDSGGGGLPTLFAVSLNSANPTEGGSTRKTE